ncbi:hypothetical protein CC1G_02804 [Coprinopsis cinerea okayama7|uniref:CHAT domain-containing protein n=1 Tax=Coprinopsis cinerea (strain Okayama-7 / 130 / ATCC MYA-4618 / FGSC 9003) TaxID=240176 RepID=A8N035_COPC7|nr:hypothetical protein CC1G_02804 [Coprinopsis cinerea okayama7\|eukprot:XP_001828223.2 hypothetical protein CC1G_02804 [Coprinopsis cinerea okayama7\
MELFKHVEASGTFEGVVDGMMVNSVPMMKAPNKEVYRRLANGTMEFAKRTANHDALHDAMGILRDFKDLATNGPQRIRGLILLWQAHLLRFVWKTWIEDLDACDMYFVEEMADQTRRQVFWEVFPGAIQTEDFRILPSPLHDAHQLLAKHVKSIDRIALDILITSGCKALSDSEDSSGDIALLLGRAHVVRYICCCSLADLDSADTYFQRAREVAGSSSPSGYAALASYSHTSWLRFLKDGTLDGMLDAKQQLNDMNTVAQVYEGNTTTLDLRISHFKRLLHMRPFPHPCRAACLNDLGTSLHDSFELTANVDHLEESIQCHQESLQLKPAPHPTRFLSLNNLAASLQSRFRIKGSAKDLRDSVTYSTESFELVPTSNPKRPLLALQLAGFLNASFRYTGDHHDLDQSISFSKVALDCVTATHKDRPMVLCQLAESLWTRFEHRGDPNDLEDSVEYSRQSLAITQESHPLRFRSLETAAHGLYIRFKYQGDRQDLERCIKLARESLALRPPTAGDNRSHTLNNLANFLCSRFKCHGDLGNIDEAVSLNEQCLKWRENPHPDRSQTLNNLASALMIRFNQTGRVVDLERSITLLQEALKLRAPPHPGRSATLNNLSNCLFDRYNYNGDKNDLEASISLSEESLRLRPSGNPGRSIPLNDLASSLLTKALQYDSAECLEECLSHCFECLTLVPYPHQDRPKVLNTLSSALATRFKYKGDVSDLEKSIQFGQEALTYMTPTDPNHPIQISNLSFNLVTLSTQEGRDHALGDSIAHCEKSLAIVLSPHPHRAQLLGALGNALTARYRRSGVQTDLDKALELFQAAAQYETSPLLERLSHTKAWISISRPQNQAEAAYRHAIHLLPLLASLDLSLEQRQNVLANVKDLSRDAVQYAIQTKQLETAIVFLSTARSIFWSQALKLRTPTDRLDAVDPSLARELREVTRSLEMAAHRTTTQARLDDSLHSLAKRREEILARIRRLDGFQDFLLPPSFSALRDAAGNGPVIFLNASQHGCDGVVMLPDGTMKHVPLEIPYDMVIVFKDSIQRLSQGHRVPTELRTICDQFEERNPRLKMSRQDRDRKTADDDFKVFLTLVWVAIVRPAINVLQLERTSSPTRVWWCPTGPFAFIPIHAAGFYLDVEGYDQEVLSDFVISSYCSSPQDLLQTVSHVSPDAKMLVVLEPEKTQPGVSGLPNTTLELAKIRAHIPSDIHLATHIGSVQERTSPETVINDIQTSSFVHFGCHGVQDLLNPLESALILSGGSLTISRIIRECQASNASLAFLSACETTMGDEQRPDEALSLAATMMFAGFRGVVGTMWSIHDEDAPIVANSFYRHLFRNGDACPPIATDAAEGLHLAIKELRELGKPFSRWVPFVHFGC